MNKVERAVDKFKKGFNCSQAVLGRNNKPSFGGRRRERPWTNAGIARRNERT